jgi:CDP-diacylglycerol--serine O-phosphatidyltransferase
MDSLADMCSFGLAAPSVVYASLAHTVPTAAAACLRAGGRLRGDPAGPLQRLAEGRQVLLRRPHHDGRRGAGRDRADRSAAARSGCSAGVALLAFAMVSSFPYAKLARW